MVRLAGQGEGPVGPGNDPSAAASSYGSPNAPPSRRALENEHFPPGLKRFSHVKADLLPQWERPHGFRWQNAAATPWEGCTGPTAGPAPLIWPRRPQA